MNSTVEETDVIFMHGGGNFGDLYPTANLIRHSITQNFPSNLIIFLPQTIKYKDLTLAENDSKIFESHQNLTMTFRSKESYLFALKTFPRTKSILVPDMAFVLGDLKTYFPQTPTIYDVLILRRSDEESKFPLGIWTQAYLEYFSFRFSYLDVDWFFYKGDKFNSSTKNYLEKLSEQRKVLLNKIISQARVVITDRLHATIYSLLIGKPVVIVDEKYKKIFNTLETAFDQKLECNQKYLDYSFASSPMDAVRQTVLRLESLK